ncbi:hypothetical protein ACFVUS_28235 [Nocardia sp. NPDC058058]|uniref:terpene synthase family protein n=1 Tax=Nocardia sp. NPDC058058 TaxID=3346317 RepID=UPI0036DA985C
MKSNPQPRPVHAIDAIAEAHRSTWSWLLDSGLVTRAATRERLERDCPAWCAAIRYPHTDGISLATQSRYVAWTFALDEELTHGESARDPATCRATVEAILANRCDRASANPLATAWGNLWQDLSSGRSNDWRSTFTTGMTTWLWDAYSTVVANRSARGARCIRSHSPVYQINLVDLCEVNDDHDVLTEIRTLPSFIRLRTSAATYLQLLNHRRFLDHSRYPESNSSDITDPYEVPPSHPISSLGSTIGVCMREIYLAREALPKDLAVIPVPETQWITSLVAADNIANLAIGNLYYYFNFQVGIDQRR